MLPSHLPLATCHCGKNKAMAWKREGQGWQEDWWGKQDWKQGWEDNKWGGGGGWGNSGADKYGNVSTLGLKHPLPLEDRRELVLGLLTRLQEEVADAAVASSPGSVAGNFRIAVASWGVVIIHAVLFYLCRAKPSMPVRTLFNEERKFSIGDAVKMLWLEHTSLFPSIDEKLAALQLCSECRFGDATALLEEAKRLGFDPGEVEGKVAASTPGSVPPRPGLANVAARVNVIPGPSGTSQPANSRALQRMSTDEELVHLKKRNEVLQLRKSLAEEEARLRNAPQVSGQSDVRVPDKPEVNQRHESAMREALPSGILKPVRLRGTEDLSTSGMPSSGHAPSGSSGSGALSLPPGDKVQMQALAQGAWSASMAMLQGKSLEQTELLNMKQWLDEVAAAAKAEASSAKPEASPAGVAAKTEHGQAPAAQTELEAKTRLEAIKSTLLAMKQQVKQEEEVMKQAALAEQPAMASENQEGHMAGGVASSSAKGIGDGKCLQASSSLATGAGDRERLLAELLQQKLCLEEQIAKGLEKEQAEKMRQAEQFRALQCEVEVLRERKAQEQKAEAERKMAEAEKRRQMELQAESEEREQKLRALQCEVEALREKETQAQAEENRQRELQAKEVQAEEMRKAEQLQALQAEVQALRVSEEEAQRWRFEREQQEQEEVLSLRKEAIALRQQLVDQEENRHVVEVNGEKQDEEEQDEEGKDADRKRSIAGETGESSKRHRSASGVGAEKSEMEGQEEQGNLE